MDKMMKNTNCLAKFSQTVAELDKEWFEWQGRLVLPSDKIDKFEAKCKIVVKAIRAFSTPRRSAYRYGHKPAQHRFCAPDPRCLIVNVPGQKVCPSC